MSEAIPGKTYEHRKGGAYRVIALAEHTETCEAMVVYRRISDQEVFVRPKTLFEDGRFTPSSSASPTRLDLEAGIASGMKAENDRLRDQVEQLSRYLHACRERGGVQDSVAPEHVADVIAQNLADEIARGGRLAAGRHKALDACDRFKDALRAVETAGPGLDVEALRQIAASALLEPDAGLPSEVYELPDGSVTADSVDAAEQWAARARDLKNALSGAFGFIVSVRDAEGSGSFADAARSFIVRHRDLLMRSGSGDVADEKILPSLPGGDDDG